MRAVTLQELLDEVRARADIENQTARFPDALLTNWINHSWQVMRSKLTKLGNPMYLQWSALTAMTIGPKAGYAFGEISIPSGAYEIFGIDVTFTANDIRSLLPVSFTERNNYWSVYGQSTGIPRHFFLENVGTESTTTVTAGKIGLLPAPDKAYLYSVAYIPAWTDITNLTYVFDGVGGWDEWVIWDVVLDVCGKDNDMRGTAAIAAAKQQSAWNELIVPAAKIQHAGPDQRVDVARMRRIDTAQLFRRYY